MELITLYHYDSITNELIAITTPYKGSELPEFSTVIEPPHVQNNEIAIFDGKAWHIEEDHRGELYYEKLTGIQFVIVDLGKVPDYLTPIAPQNEDDVWQDNKWVSKPEPTKPELIEQANELKKQKIADTTFTIEPLKDAESGGYITEEDSVYLTELKKYRYLLTNVDTSTAPNIEWPEMPVSV